jgi:hypothetical protein
MSGDENGMEDLRQSSSFGDRDDTDHDPWREENVEDQSDDEESSDPVEALVEYLIAVRDGDSTPSIGCRDDMFAAYLEFLKDNPEEMLEAGEQITAQLEHPPSVDYDDKAAIIRLLLRAGLQETLPEHYELISEANAEYARRNP